MEQNAEKWAIEVTEDNVQELSEWISSHKTITTIGSGWIGGQVSSDFQITMGDFTKRGYPLITIEQFREKYGKKEKSSIEKLKELGVKVSKADLSYLHNMKPVIYFLPEQAWIKDRVEEIETAIKEALTANLCIPTEWVTEYNKHIEWLKNN